MEHQEFNGIIFYQTEPSDYFRHSVQGTTILMHRYVWEFYNCKIPKGYHVHHRDGNKANNDISNLQLLSGVEHWTLHGKLLTDEEREWRRKNIVENAVPKAKEWHKSSEGKEWHKEQYKKTKDAMHKKINKVCCNCGGEYLGESKSKFCSATCKSAYRRRTGADLVERNCIICGKLFKTNKNKSGLCCSPQCRAKLGHSRKGN